MDDNEHALEPPLRALLETFKLHPLEIRAHEVPDRSESIDLLFPLFNPAAVETGVRKSVPTTS